MIKINAREWSVNSEMRHTTHTTRARLTEVTNKFTVKNMYLQKNAYTEDKELEYYKCVPPNMKCGGGRMSSDNCVPPRTFPSPHHAINNITVT